MPGSFVGRAGELAALVDLVQGLTRHRGPAVAVVHGDPGSGKSRLLAEACPRIALDEQILLAGYQPEAGVPLAMASGLLRRLAERSGQGGWMRSLLDPGLEAGPVEPVRLFEAAHRALAALGPTLVVVDDAQWVDEVSLGLLHYLVRAAEVAGQPLATVVASRPSGPARRLAGSLARVIAEPHRFLQLRLRPLDRDAGVRLALELAPALQPTQAADVWRRARGSPFWLHRLAASGTPTADAAALLADRLDQVGLDAAGLLDTLALVGRPLAPEDAAALQGWSPNRVAAAAAELIAAELAVDLSGSLQPAHDLIRESVAASIPAHPARRLHRRLAGWLEGLAGDDELLLLEALEHRGAGAMPALDLALRLARSPRRRLLGRDGLRKLAAIADQADLADPAARELQRHIAALAAELGEHELALTRWAAVAREPGRRVGTARAALAASESALHLRRAAEAWQWLARARQASTGNDPAIAIELDAHESALHRHLEHRAEASRAAAGRAVRAARLLAARAGGVETLGVPERRTYVRALLAGTEAALEADELEEMLALSEELVAAAAQVDDGTRVRALGEGALALRLLGRNREAEPRLREAWQETRRLVLPQATVEIGVTYAVVLWALGRLEEATTVAEEVQDLGQRLEEFAPARAFTVAARSLIALSTGEWRTAVAALRAAAEQEPEPHYRLHAHLERAVALARLDPARAGPEVATAVADALADAERAGCRRCLTEATVRGAEAIARIGRVDDAGRLLGRPASVDRGSTGFVAWWRSRAMASVELRGGDALHAASLLESVATEAERQGLLLEAIWAQLDLGLLLTPVDPKRAGQVLRAAGAEAARMGAATEARLADQGLRALGVRTWRRGRAVGHGDPLARLSERERQIAGRVASGASNPEIADALFLSRKTVERHVSNILAKLGVRNRTELAAALAPLRRPPGAEVEGPPR